MSVMPSPGAGLMYTEPAREDGMDVPAGLYSHFANGPGEEDPP